MLYRVMCWKSIFFFCAGVWTCLLCRCSTAWATPQSSLLFYFLSRVLCCASCTAGITDMQLVMCQASFLRWGLANFLPGLNLNHDFPYQLGLLAWAITLGLGTLFLSQDLTWFVKYITLWYWICFLILELQFPLL
jgi:hypothetical protein